MISFTSLQWEAWLTAFFWPFFRILGLVVASPFFGARGISASTKIGFAIFITILLAPLLAPMPAIQPTSAQGLLIILHQLMIGIAMGIAVRVVFTALEMAGHIMGLQMGLGFATFFDPQNSAQIPVMGQFMGLMGMLLFLSINGHLMVMTALMESFEFFPIGVQPIASEGWLTLALWGGEIFRAGVLMALPVLAVLMMTNIALAVLTRAAPQLNIFAVGFPLTLGVGFVVISLALPYIFPVFAGLIEKGVQTMLEIAAGAGVAAYQP